MRLTTLLPLLSISLPITGTAAKPSAPPSRLWATHYNGNVYTLTLDKTTNNLSITDTQKTCGKMPSWLTFDTESQIVYCSDEDGTADPSTHGSLTAYHPDREGKLHQLSSVKTVGGGVDSVIYEAGKEKLIAIAHYTASQEFHFKLTHPGAVAQQDSPHPHSVFLDPTGSFIVSPDLGADLLRIYSISSTTGKLTTCPPVNVTFGSGPRHGLFWTDGTDNNRTANGDNGVSHQREMAAVGKTMMYLANEIGGTVMVFDVSYARSGCLDLQRTQTLVPYPASGQKDHKLPTGATPAEIRLIGDKFYVSVRSDQGFAPSDSMVTLDRSAKSGAVKVSGKSDAWGKVPRTFAVNRAGDLVAIGNQASANVAIVRRDRVSGELGEKVAVLQVGEPGKVGQAEGLSSVIWEE
ncbi:hypothetical protein N7509_000662 [Penicillium cosmopolitanum]|uniref:6-phosphogluconolactonase n=1 Tax=Penicillium cosmopolitanum TaxID=1131564 RepID=A0A9X0BEE4_9EURO|nr:uncharacterized protein N7509_000662 [Penicillium cosmopolitanum]KAJ5414035.1 hypothetical protein N7509_000662 [Penicillium cosmopolitanum]